MTNRFQTTEDGIEYTFAVNHLGHFALTYQLLDLIRRNPRCKVINMASLAHKKVEELDVTRLNDEDYYDP